MKFLGRRQGEPTYAKIAHFWAKYAGNPPKNLRLGRLLGQLFAL
jgi:hypothetical protein